MFGGVCRVMTKGVNNVIYDVDDLNKMNEGFIFVIYFKTFICLII